jgi:hypothetical protein
MLKLIRSHLKVKTEHPNQFLGLINNLDHEEEDRISKTQLNGNRMFQKYR